MNKDFYKAIFSGEKKLFHISEVKHIIVPKLQELSVKNLAEQIKNDDALKKYLPDKWEATKKLDRDWLFNIINTVHPGFLQ